jgi:AraC-like DNA-binding protein
MPPYFTWTENILLIVTLLGVLQGAILALVVKYYPERDKNSNNWLSLFIASMVLVLMAPGVQYILSWQYVFIMHALKFIPIASLYLYIRSLSEDVSFRKAWRHFIIVPLYLPVAYLLINYLVRTYGAEAFYAGVSDPIANAASLLTLAYLLGYLYLDYRAYLDHKRKVEGNFSQHHKLGLQWIRQLIIGYLMIIFFSYSLYGVMFDQPDQTVWYCIINMAVITAFLYFVTIKGKLSPEIYKLKKIEAAKREEHSASPAAGQTDEALVELADRAVRVLEQEQLYKEEAITIKEFSERLDTQPYLVSQAINAVLQKNFFDLINGYRVEEAKRLLKDPDFHKYSLVAIGFEAGFNSKTAFNTVFKKYTGLTPSEYKKSDLQLQKN